MGIVDELSKRGIKVWLMGERVRVFPKERLTDDLRREIAKHRDALVAELSELEAALPKPYFRRNGSLVIPFDSPKRYHWWAGGQSVSETIKEISESGGCDGDNETDCRE